MYTDDPSSTVQDGMAPVVQRSAHLSLCYGSRLPSTDPTELVPWIDGARAGDWIPKGKALDPHFSHLGLGKQSPMMGHEPLTSLNISLRVG